MQDAVGVVPGCLEVAAAHDPPPADAEESPLVEGEAVLVAPEPGVDGAEPVLERIEERPVEIGLFRLSVEGGVGGEHLVVQEENGLAREAGHLVMALNEGVRPMSGKT